jgi:farnesol dehydrogenase
VKIFLTGGTGYLGSALLEGLLDAGHEVSVLTRKPRDEGAGSRLRWVKGDLLDGPPDPQVLHQHGVVLHAAAMVKTWARDRSEFDRVNVESYDRLLSDCYRLGISRVIHTSSFLSLGPSPTPEPIGEDAKRSRERFYTDYERTKHRADAITEHWTAKGMPIVSLYPTVMFGPGRRTDGNLVGKMIHWIVTDKFPGIVGSGRQVWSYAYLPDVVRGHLAAVERGLGGQRFILGGENLALEDLVRMVYEILGRPPKMRHLPIWLAETLGSMSELGARFTGNAPDLTRGVAGVYREHWSYRSSRAGRALGYTITPFREALETTVRWVAALPAWEENE